MLLTHITPEAVPEGGDAVAERVRADLPRERALALARDAARAVAASIKTAMDGGADFDTAKGDIFFNTPPAFDLSQGLNHADANEIVTAAKQTPAGQFAGAFDTPNGAVLVYVRDHVLPTKVQVDSEITYSRFMILRTMPTALFGAVDQELDDKYPVSLTPEWQYLSPTADELAVPQL
jgi:hypothetical protein